MVYAEGIESVMSDQCLTLYIEFHCDFKYFLQNFLLSFIITEADCMRKIRNNVDFVFFDFQRGGACHTGIP